MNATTARVLVSHALASVGMSLPWPLLLVLAWEHTHSDLALGATGAARMLPYVLLSWAAGRLADRHRRDQVVAATLIGRGGALVVAAVAVASGQVTVAIAACSVAVAIGTPAFPALAAAVPTIPCADRGRVTELLVTVEISSFVVGPALGGLLLTPSLRPAIPAGAVALLAAAWWVLRGVVLPAPSASAARAGMSRRSSLLRGQVGRTIAAMSTVNFMVALVALALLPMAEGLWGGTAQTYGLAAGALGFGALAGPLMRWLGRTDPQRVRLGMAGLGVLLAAIVPAQALVWAVAPLALAGAVAVHVEAAATSILQDSVPDGCRASWLGAADTAMVGAALLGSLVGPVAITHLGPQIVLLATASAAVIAGLLVTPGRSTVLADQPLAAGPSLA